MCWPLSNRRGFTLLELLVVIAIIGLMSSVVLASLNSARDKANDAKRVSDIHQLVQALAAYYQDNGAYPACAGYSVWDATYWNRPTPSCLYTALVPKYIHALPKDPTNAEGGSPNVLGDNYPTDQGYVYNSAGKTYVLGTNLSKGGTANNYGNYEITNQ